MGPQSVRLRSTVPRDWPALVVAVAFGTVACGNGSKDANAPASSGGSGGSGSQSRGGHTSAGQDAGGSNASGSDAGGESSSGSGSGASAGRSAGGQNGGMASGGRDARGGSSGSGAISDGGALNAMGGKADPGGRTGDSGAAGDAGAAGAESCPVPKEGSGSVPASCYGLPADCGPNRDADCCESRALPGGTFNRINDARYPATVSAFRLDTFEATLGRFQTFLSCYPANLPAAGSGKNPNDPNDPGWDAAWNQKLAVDARALVEAVSCGKNATYGQADPHLPMNCLDWYTAFAFCIWDGGRLPTEAEWNYAAAGGDQQRVYPWSNPPENATIDETLAVLKFPLLPVGSTSPAGNSRWGQADLAGSVREWAVDFGYSLLVYPTPCTDCVHWTSDGGSRVNRGGGASDTASSARTTVNSSVQPESRVTHLGVRCARSP